MMVKLLFAFSSLPFLMCMHAYEININEDVHNYDWTSYQNLNWWTILLLIQDS